MVVSFQNCINFIFEALRTNISTMKTFFSILSIILFGIIYQAKSQFNYDFILVKDINTNTFPNKSSWPNTFTYLNDSQFVFVAFVDSIGWEMWVSNGTESGTHLIKNINTTPEAGQNSDEDCCEDTEIARVGNKLIFAAHTNDYGTEPWITDGTESGTYLLKNIYVETSFYAVGSSPSYFTAYNDKVIFVANDGSGRKVYVTDGTEQGTYPIVSTPGFMVPSLLYENPFTEYNGKLYFPARDNSTNGNTSLWVTDGTDTGTYMIKKLHFGSNDVMFPSAVLDGKLYFTADSNFISQLGRELWVTDGTAMGTQIVSDINTTPGPIGSNPQNFAVLNDKLYFSASHDSYGKELFGFDGTNNFLVKDIDVFYDSNPKNLYTYNDKIFFSASHMSGYPPLLYTTDGTSAGTKIFHNEIFGPEYFFEWDNKLFIISHADSGYDLWATNGSEDSTFKITPLNCYLGNIPYITEDALYLNFLVGQINPDNTGYELYKLIKANSLSSEPDNLISKDYVYPNPFSDYVTIALGELSERREVVLNDILGNEILRKKIPTNESSVHLELPDLSKGLYFLTIITNDDRSSNKIKLLKK
jgi:ELWxxDGT repeat protein